MQKSAYVIVGLGELLWDVFPNERRPGGAPANVAYHASVLENTGIVVSRVGKDKAGNDLLEFLENKKLNISHIQRDKEKPTGTVQVTIENGEPAYTITEDVAWDFLEFSDSFKALALQADAICFGTLAQRNAKSRAVIRQFLKASPDSTLKVLDVNLREPFYSKEIISQSIELANVIKLNLDEWNILGKLFHVSDPIRWLLNEGGIQLVCLTKGRDGSELITRDNRFTQRSEILDVSTGDAVGVGDAFTAALTGKLLQDQPLEEVLQFANTYAGHVATLQGGMPEISNFNL